MNSYDILVEDVGFSYGSLVEQEQGANGPSRTLRDIQLKVRPGTVTLLCGPSGSGKTTLLQLLNGLVPHFRPGELQGHVHVCGQDMSTIDLTDVGRMSATVFQNPRSQFFCTRAVDEIAFCLENYGHDPQQVDASVKAAIDAIGITHLAERDLDKMSGGELQKVACACAVAADVPLVLLDEPTSNLSPEAIDELGRTIAEFKQQGRTIVISEHRLHWLRGIVDQVVLLQDGGIVEELTGEEFYALSDHQRLARGLRTLCCPELEDTNVHEEHLADMGIVLEEIRFSYGGTRVLDIDQLSLPAGRITMLVGENGAGKSTLCRIVCGLSETTGQVRMAGRPTTARQRLRESFLVMQDVNRQLFSDSVLTEVTLGAPTPEDGKDHTHELLAAFDLDQLADRHPQSLSGGQKQRLAIASALACSKHVLVFDEPTSGVDHRHMEIVADSLRQLAEQGHVVLVVSHDLELAAACADRIITLRRLDTLSDGQPQATLTTLTPRAPRTRKKTM